MKVYKLLAACQALIARVLNGGILSLNVPFYRIQAHWSVLLESSRSNRPGLDLVTCLSMERLQQ
jgi:hypothetical protein